MTTYNGWKLHEIVILCGAALALIPTAFVMALSCIKASPMNGFICSVYEIGIGGSPIAVLVVVGVVVFFAGIAMERCEAGKCGK